MPTLFKVSFSGTIDPGAEQFVHSMWIDDITSNNSVGYVASELSGAITAMLATACTSSVPAANLGLLFPDTVSWLLCEARQWNAATNAQVGPPAQVVLTDVGTGSGSFALPNQSSLAVSTRTGLTGRRRWNRFYLPPMIITATAGGDFVNQNVCDALSDWLVALNLQLNALTPALGIAHYSPAAGTFSTPPDSTFIGNRLDTVRRRANQLTETRSISPF